MPNILEDFPYPWHKKEAQQLHLTLCQVSRTKGETILAAEKSGVQIYEINTEQATYLVWAEILDYSAKHGLTRKLVQDVFDRLTPTSPARPFLSQLLENAPIIPDAEPRGNFGAPLFFKGTDEIREPEALLFRDDLTLETGKIPQLINTLQKMISLSPAICKFIVNINGNSQSGTGFRIGPDQLLTNWHVLHDKNDGTQATVVTAEFKYEDDGEGGVLTATPIKCDVTTIVSSKEDDWAVIKTKEQMQDTWPIIKLSEGVMPEPNSSAFIIQHPQGVRKRLGFIRNQVSGFDDRIVHYLTDTQEGSSGSPVFDQSGKLFALHHAGGRPQEVLGRPPMSKNEGILITKVLQGLNNQGVIVP